MITKKCDDGDSDDEFYDGHNSDDADDENDDGVGDLVVMTAMRIVMIQISIYIPIVM